VNPINALRDGEEFYQESDHGNSAEAPVYWDRIVPLVGDSQGPLVDRTFTRG